MTVARDVPAPRSSADAAPPSRSASRVMDILDLFLSTDDGLTLTEIAGRLGVPKSTAHGLLRTMLARGYLSWDPRTKAYMIGLRLIGLARSASILKPVQSRARAHLERLALELQESALLIAYESKTVVCVDKVDSPRPIRYSVSIGERWPLYCTTAGRLFLARLSDDEVRELLANERFERYTKETPASIDEVLAGLPGPRRDGFAINREEIVPEVTGCGAPVYGYDGALLAALSVVGPTERVTPLIDEISRALVAEASALSAELAGDGRHGR